MNAGRAEPTMPVAAVARRLGIAPSTLRTWDRRYGLGPGCHTGGKHRRYGPTDIARLELMQRALLRGASTAEAARYCLDQVPKSAPPAEVPAEPGPLPAAHGLPDSTTARRLRAAALALDSWAVQRTLAETIADVGVTTAWESVIEPVQIALGTGWHGSPAGTEVEYLFGECVLAALVRATPVLESPRNQRPVLLSGAPGERDVLPLYALAACLAERRIGTQLFGDPLPRDALAAAMRRGAPAAVVLLASSPVVVDATLFADDPRGRPRRRLFAWGPGWCRAPLPDRVEALADLRTAAARLEYVLLGQ
ncbi:MerR family transcriptional regulator [Amycolatopsis pigmentata]|uniref:MerR family transcriptional regulator n=1 Tax=Amycolatopsis pigmentata TaxID=450801 RepID=A0ABW5G4V7_9PSEU